MKQRRLADVIARSSLGDHGGAGILPRASTVAGNVMGFNDFRGSDFEMAFFTDAAEANNTVSRNLGENRGHGLSPASIFRPAE